MSRMRIPAALVALLLALALAACGGDDGATTDPTTETAAREGTTTSTAAERQPRKEQGGNPSGGEQERNRGGADGGGSAGAAVDKTLSRTPPIRSGAREGQKAAAPGVPTSKGGDNSVQTYGVEASGASRRRAAAVLQTYLDARAAGRWAKACFYLAAPMRAQLRQFVKDAAGCVDAIEALTAGVPKAALRQNTRIDEVLSFRVKGASAFLLFNGPPKTTLYEAPLARESGEWRVAALAPSALPH